MTITVLLKLWVITKRVPDFTDVLTSFGEPCHYSNFQEKVNISSSHSCLEQSGFIIYVVQQNKDISFRIKQKTKMED